MPAWGRLALLLPPILLLLLLLLSPPPPRLDHLRLVAARALSACASALWG
jgi:hypothetical protein